MLARVPRLPGKLLAGLFGAATLVHTVLAARGFFLRWHHPGELAQNAVWLALAFAVAALGRLLLSFLPPGPTGGHGPRELPETWAASLALGWLSVGALGPLVAHGWIVLAEHRSAGRWIFVAVVAASALALLAMRWLTLPGAMVPRHAAGLDLGRLRVPLVLAALVGLGFAATTRAFLAALAWLALGLLLERGLARARRAPVGRALFLVAFVGLGFPGSAGIGEDHDLTGAFGIALALGVGAAALVPWLRRTDRRAGWLAALFLAAPALRGWTWLAAVGPLVFVLFSRGPQRRFALTIGSSALLAFAAVGSSWPARERGRLLWADELLRTALEHEVWGLAWPFALAALALGGWTFPWTARWEFPAVEEPRREVLALAALTTLVALALASPASPWFEPDALLVLFPLVALLAALLVIPPERQGAA